MMTRAVENKVGSEIKLSINLVKTDTCPLFKRVGPVFINGRDLQCEHKHLRGVRAHAG